MPQIFRIGPYIIYFWSNESDPLEPIHVHIAEGRAAANGTKVWITGSGKALLCNNDARIPAPVLRDLMRIIEANSGDIVKMWLAHFGQIEYFC